MLEAKTFAEAKGDIDRALQLLERANRFYERHGSPSEKRFLSILVSRIRETAEEMGAL